VISIFIGKFLAREPVRIDWDGDQTRDYVYVTDVARANLDALERGSGGCYVIGTGVRTSVNDVYRALVDLTGFEAPVERAPQRPGDARDAQFDSARARSEIGWSPSTPLADGIRATYEYFQRSP
jgi:UDP-glucose 4-epimerase